MSMQEKTDWVKGVCAIYTRSVVRSGNWRRMEGRELGLLGNDRASPLARLP